MKIRCLLCNKEFVFLPTHLRSAHGTSAEEYKSAFDLPAMLPLASDEYREAHAEKMRRMQADGTLTYEHLPVAMECARSAGRPAKTKADAERHAQRMAEVQPWAARQLPPGTKRADGRDADRARETQRQRRRALKTRS